MKIIKTLTLLFFLTTFYKVSGQNTLNKKSNFSSIYTVFNTFFENEIKKQGVKGNWIFKLEQITGLHKFDYNNDGVNDVLMEFSAVQELSEGITLYFAVLFENNSKGYKLVNFLKTRDIRFDHFEENLFYFNSSLNKKNIITYKLKDTKFVKQ